MNTVIVGGDLVHLNILPLIASGGEADVYEFGKRALKVYFTPDHPALDGQREKQRLAQRRLDAQQRKLIAFPIAGLPDSVIQPEVLARDPASRQIVGYTMRYVKGAEPLFRYTDSSVHARVGNTAITATFVALHALVTALHQAGVVIGDFTDANILVEHGKPVLIDTDSMQFRGFPCTEFKSRFIDPLICDATQKVPVLARPFNDDADWYAYALMLFECLMLVHPYGGIYKPPKGMPMVGIDSRSLAGISVFSKHVIYPGRAVPFMVLPDVARDVFYGIFEQQRRGVFPLQAIASMHWVTCSTCHLSHARTSCPVCHPHIQVPVVPPMHAPEMLPIRLIAQSRHAILAGAVRGGKPLWLETDGVHWVREDGTEIGQGDVDLRLRIRLGVGKTYLGKGGQVITFAGAAVADKEVVDQFTGAVGRGALPVFDVAGDMVIWSQGGTLYRAQSFSGMRKSLGTCLAGQTMVWCGPTFGFGFYRLGARCIGFVFDNSAGNLNDAVPLPVLSGTLVDVTATFSEERCWWFVALQDQGAICHHCFVIRRDGTLSAASVAERGDGTWLGTLRGGCAIKTGYFAPIDGGIARLTTTQGRIEVAQEYRLAEGVMKAETRLLSAPDGVYLVDATAIRHVTLAGQ